MDTRDDYDYDDTYEDDADGYIDTDYDTQEWGWSNEDYATGYSFREIATQWGWSRATKVKLLLLKVYLKIKRKRAWWQLSIERALYKLVGKTHPVDDIPF